MSSFLIVDGSKGTRKNPGIFSELVYMNDEIWVEIPKASDSTLSTDALWKLTRRMEVVLFVPRSY